MDTGAKGDMTLPLPTPQLAEGDTAFHACNGTIFQAVRSPAGAYTEIWIRLRA